MNTASEVEWFDSRAARFAEAPTPPLPPEADLAWARAARQNPLLFDGPLVLCTRFRPGDNALITWSRASYRYRALRDIPGTPSVSAVFVGVIQPTFEGRIAAGRTAAWTSRPARLQLPGGSMEPPRDGAPLTLDALSAHASVELREEIGVVSTPDALVPLNAGRMPNGNIGFFFVARVRREDDIRDCFAMQGADDRSRGVEPEFRELVFIDPDKDIGEAAADHLAPVVRRYRLRSDHEPDVLR